MIIHGISGEEGSRSAIVTFDREQLLLFEGDQDRNKKFKVIRIDEKEDNCITYCCRSKARV